ncbi:MAG: hypothetical protein KBG15_05255 [Kofleriaceae bacterium]|nr:hypothetical protein [Kofleriaceae bacterium]
MTYFHPWSVLAAAVGVLLGLTRPAVACDAASRFDLFDRADRVIVGTITTPLAQRNYRRRGRVTVAVQTVIKGTAPSTLTVRADIGMCAAELSPGATALMFLDSNGVVVGEMEGYVELEALTPAPPTPPAPPATNPAATDWPAMLAAWGQATDDLAKLDLLIRAVAVDEHTGLARQASDYLVNQPRLLRLIDDVRRKAIVAAVEDDRWMPNYTILILARLRAPELLPLLDKRYWNYDADMRGLLAADAFTSETDRVVLARAITAKNSSESTRAAALDRCEMLRGESLARYVSYLYRSPYVPITTHWPRLAKACRR